MIDAALSPAARPDRSAPGLATPDVRGTEFAIAKPEWAPGQRLSVTAGPEAAWAEEIERRIAQIDAGEVGLVSWHDIKARLLAPDHAGQKP